MSKEEASAPQKKEWTGGQSGNIAIRVVVYIKPTWVRLLSPYKVTWIIPGVIPKQHWMCPPTKISKQNKKTHHIPGENFSTTYPTNG